LSITLILTALLLFGAQMTDETGLTVIGRITAILGLGSLASLAIEVVVHPKYFGRAFAVLGLDTKVVLPIFREDLDDSDGERPSLLATVARIMVVVLLVAAPLGMALHAFFSQTLSGRIELTTEGVEETSRVEAGGVSFERELGLRLGLHSDGAAGTESATLVATNPTTGESVRPVARLGSRLRLEDSYVSIHGWRPLLTNRRASFAVVSKDDGSMIESVTLSPGQSAELADGGELRFIESRDAFLELLGPAAQVEMTSNNGEKRQFWVFQRAPDFDRVHGTGETRLQLTGFKPGVAAIFHSRDSAGWRWDLLALGYLAILCVAFFLRSISNEFLTGRSGDYMVTSSGFWSFRTDVSSQRRDEIERAWRRRDNNDRDSEIGAGGAS
jgi:hypothetical protein